MKKIVLGILGACGVLLSNAQKIPDFKEAIKLGENINTSSEEAKPVLNADGTIMYFVRAFHPENEGYEEHKENEDIWEAVKDANGDWKKAEHEVTINDEKNNSIIGKGKEDHYFLLNTYQDKKYLDYGIAETRKLAEHSWTKPDVIKIPKLKYDGDFYDFYITHDEQILIISIKGEDTKGSEDLYVSKKIDKKWSEPVNLGDKINTSGFEMSPFLTEDKKFLYFSTNGRNDGKGDADVYVTERLDDSWTNWSEPKNLGDVVNSPKMDCYFTMSDNGDYYFSSNREGSDGLDIYQLSLHPPLVTVLGKIYNSKDSSELVASLVLTKLSDNSEVLSTDDKSNYISTVDFEDNYKLEAVKEGFSSFSYDYDFSKYKKGDTITTNIYLTPKDTVIPVIPSEAIVLKRVLHDFDQSVHTGGTGINIDDVVAKMKENPWLKIRIESHTDSKGSDEYNMRLSERRAKGARTYLIRRGISGARIEAKWYGETIAVAPNKNADGSDNLEGRAQNRRTEFKITSERPD